MNVVFSEEATKQLKTLLAAEGEPKPALRIGVMGQCHCGNVHFGMGWDEASEDDTVLKMEGFQVIVDPESAPYLEEAEVDYKEDVMQAGFVIRSENAQGGCSCGSH